jgi:hypothetical protein
MISVLLTGSNHPSNLAARHLEMADIRTGMQGWRHIPAFLLRSAINPLHNSVSLAGWSVWQQIVNSSIRAGNDIVKPGILFESNRNLVKILFPSGPISIIDPFQIADRITASAIGIFLRYSAFQFNFQNWRYRPVSRHNKQSSRFIRLCPSVFFIVRYIPKIVKKQSRR